MKQIYLSIFLLVITASNMLCQNKCACLTDNPSVEMLEDKILAQNYSYKILPDIQFFNDWTSGDVLLTSGDIIHSQMLRYNGYMDALFWVRKRDYLFAIVERNIVASFVLYDVDHKLFASFKKIKMRGLNGSSDSVDVYLQVLAEGKLSLYARRKITVFKTDNNYFKDYTFYLWKEGVMYPINMRRRSLLKLMGSEKLVMRGIIRENNLDVSNENQMIKAIELYNQR
jgi:hypothetical protein